MTDDNGNGPRPYDYDLQIHGTMGADAVGGTALSDGEPPYRSDMVAWRIPEVLQDPQIPFGCKEGGMPKRQLNLIQTRLPLVSELSECAPHIMRCNLNADCRSIPPHSLVDGI